MSELYDFKNLKEFLKKKGISVNEGTGYQIIRTNVGKSEIENKEISFDDFGIYYVDKQGLKHQGYMYQDSYKVSAYGLPRFHVLKCKTIQEFLDRGLWGKYYRFSTAKTNDIIERSNVSMVYKEASLSLCGYCRKVLIEMQLEESETTEDFFKMMGGNEEEVPQDVEIDMFGYVKGWIKISEKYRASQEYSCEKCGIILIGLNKRFLEVHHINGNKLDNRETNLQCLCIHCHSEIDEHHIENYKSRANRTRLEAFSKIIGNQ